MNLLLTTIAPVFGVVAIGFFAVRLRLVRARGAKALVLFVFNVAIPVMLFYRMAAIDFPDRIEWGFLLAFYGAAFSAYAVGIAVARFGFERPRDEQAIFGMGAGFSNTVLLGIPLLLTAFGDEATLPVFMIIAFHSVTLLPMSVALIQAGRRDRSSDSQTGMLTLLREVLANPIIIGIAAGIGANRLGMVLPAPIDAAAGFMATLAIPCALFALGTSLASYPLKGELRPAATLAALKLTLQPTVAWVIAVPVLGLGFPWAPVAVVMAGMPSGAMVYLFGARYEAAPALAASTVLLSSAASVVTLTAWLVWMGG